MPLVMVVGLGQSDFVLDGDPAPLPKRGRRPSLIFGPCPLWPNGWTDQDGTWKGGGTWYREPAPFPQKGGGAHLPNFRPFPLWPNGWMHQDATWYGGRPQPRRLCVTWKPSPPPKKGAEPPYFRLMFIAAKRLDASRCHLAW